jgi:hypothetical protein
MELLTREPPESPRSFADQVVSVLCFLALCIGLLMTMTTVGSFFMKEWWWNSSGAIAPERLEAIKMVRGMFLSGIVWLTAAAFFGVRRWKLGLALVLLAIIVLMVSVPDR